ncbi:MAG: ABC transporter permease subunit [Myxococcota bacterium]
MTVLWPRPSRIVAVARRDLAQELKGRQGLLLPGVLTLLLVPASTIPSPVRQLADPLADIHVSVEGDVPEGVAEAEGVVDPRKANLHLRFRQEPDVLLVRGLVIPDAVREILDHGDPVVTVDYTPRGYALPGRTALLSLISASTLTGAVSQSIGGERSRKTLGVLLAAAITRSEIVLGKWLAWGGFGATAALVGAAGAILAGNVQPGWWVLPLPTVPLATVALGLWLVRRAGDVMAGSATALRVLPAALSILGVLAWVLGDSSKWVGAMVPLGGSLLAAGDMWAGPWLPLLASASTLAMAGAMLAATVRDLDESVDRSLGVDPTLVAAAAGGLAALGWWLPVGAPALWAAAGNPRIVEGLDPNVGIAAGTAVFALLVGAVALRSTERAPQALGMGRPTVRGVGVGLVGGLALAGAAWAAGQVPPLVPGAFGAPRRRLPPRPAAAGRRRHRGGGGVVPRLAHPADGRRACSVVWTLVRAPLDPALGLATGVVCGLVARWAARPRVRGGARGVVAAAGCERDTVLTGLGCGLRAAGHAS